MGSHWYLIGWVSAMVIGAIVAFLASQKATRHSAGWGIGIFFSSVLLGLLGIVISVILFFIFGQTSEPVRR